MNVSLLSQGRFSCPGYYYRPAAAERVESPQVFADLSLRMAESMQCKLAYLHDGRAVRSYGAHGSGPAGGLRDVYWINYYGCEFVELIGREKVLGAPGASATEFASGAVAVRLGSSFPDSAARAAVREFLGER